MASPGGAYSSGCSSLQNSGSGSEGDLMMKKRKRMQSNRESARRSRMRKQQHLEELGDQVEQLKKENQQISANIGVTTQMYMNVESENAILRVQMDELNNRLQSLNEIIHFIESSSLSSSSSSNSYGVFQEIITPTPSFGGFNDCGFMDTWNSLPDPLNYNQQPIMASADHIFMY